MKLKPLKIEHIWGCFCRLSLLRVMKKCLNNKMERLPKKIISRKCYCTIFLCVSQLIFQLLFAIRSQIAFWIFRYNFLPSPPLQASTNKSKKFHFWKQQLEKIDCNVVQQFFFFSFPKRFISLASRCYRQRVSFGVCRVTRKTEGGGGGGESGDVQVMAEEGFMDGVIWYCIQTYV